MEKIALVTGGNRGIGKEICRQLAAEGFTVVLAARDLEKARAAASEMKGVFAPRQLDLSDPQSIRALVKNLHENFSHLDVLVNNAGIISRSNIVHADEQEWREVMEVNFHGPVHLTTSLLSLLRKSRGARIVNVSSGMGANGDLHGSYAAYRLSKNALNGFTRMLASELEGSSIKVNAICPGWVRTEMGGSGAPRSVEKGAETVTWLASEKHIPNGKFFRDKKIIPW